MAQPKLSGKQQAQLAWLQTVEPRLQRVAKIVELMAALQADDTQVRQMCRILDELKVQAQGLGLSGLADPCGYMGQLARRGGGLQMKVRGLRDLLGSVKVGFDAAMKQATTPEGPAGHAPEG